ncbi:MAG: SUF system NifU family Fe-S cluster assembly protein [Candidatus Marinimicrobia bacterium]|nr:SUF system NifU family Fe-S cluster assembly protein [Candidatus Neomarinimicrobiota bacterium]
MSLNGLYKEVILDHYRTPRHRGVIQEPSFQEGGHNPSCGDTLEIFVSVDEDENIVDVSFEGHGCSISMASSSMMTELVLNKSLDEALELVKVFEGMMQGEAEFPDTDEYLDVVSLKGVADFPVRLKCATLAWDTIKRGIERYRDQ